MGVIAWIVVGLVAGWLAHLIMGGRGGIFGNIAVGLVGAIVGGFLMRQFGAAGVTGLNLYSLLVAVVGAVVFLIIYHAIRRAA